MASSRISIETFGEAGLFQRKPLSKIADLVGEVSWGSADRQILPGRDSCVVDGKSSWEERAFLP